MTTLRDASHKSDETRNNARRLPDFRAERTIATMGRRWWILLVAPALSACIVASCGGSNGHNPPLPATIDTGTDAKARDSSAPTEATAPDAAEAASDQGEASLDVLGETESADSGPFMGDVTAVDGDSAVYAACGDGATSDDVITAGGCSIDIKSWPDAGAAHVPVGTDVVYCTVPPNSGPHWPVWAAFKSYAVPVPHQMLVHDMEHGAVVIFYRCTGSCPTVATQLQAVIDARPVDPLCTAASDAGPLRRLILVPDPTLDVAIAAAAWQWTYRADCVDAASLGAFIDAHYAKAAENFCADGIVPP